MDLKRSSRVLRSAGVLACAAALAAPGVTHAGGTTNGGTMTGATSGGTVPPLIEVHSKGFQVTAPKTIRPGLVNVSYVNNGGLWSGVMVGRLKPGATVASVQHALKTANEGAFYGQVAALGGVYGPANGYDTVDMENGTYLVADVEQVGKHKFVSASRFFTVNGAAPAGQTLNASATLMEKDFKFVGFTKISAGVHTVHVVNDAPEPHEWVIFRLAPGITMKDVMAYLKHPQGPPPGTSFGGFGEVDPGMSAYYTTRFTAGNYVSLCFVEDPKTHKSHADLGMVASLTVR